MMEGEGVPRRGMEKKEVTRHLRSKERQERHLVLSCQAIRSLLQ